jgi:hypothetical protein
MYGELRTHKRVAELAARQYGVVTRRQLIELGCSEETIDRNLEAGGLQAWNRSVLTVGDHGPSPHGLCMAAVLFRGQGALISHQSAIWLWGLEPKLEIPVHVSMRRRGHPGDAIALHHSPDLRDEDVAETEGLPVTAVPRALLDYAADAKRRCLERAIDKADRLGLLDLAAVARLTEEAPGHRGRGRLRRAMAVYGEEGFTPSRGEKWLLAALADAGVRRPAVNDFVAGHELDFLWRPERLAVELDSWEHHRPRRSSQEERERQEALAIAGIDTIRISGTRLRREPRKVANRIAEELDRRGRREEAA